MRHRSGFAVVAIVLAAIVATGCSSPTPWEEHGEARWSEQPGVFELTRNMDQVIESYNFNYKSITKQLDSPDDCARAYDDMRTYLTSGLYWASEGEWAAYDKNLGEVLAYGEWRELNDCPDVDD